MSLKLEVMILDEYLSFRSYVSHTLCKNRFFIYVNRRNMKAFTEPNVWPILKREAESLFDLGPTLYGITCKAVFEDDKKNIDNALSEIDILKNEKVWSNDIDKSADTIKEILEEIPDKFNKAADFRVDISKVKSVKTENTLALKNRIKDLINKIIIPLVGHVNLDNSEDYWKSYPEIMRLIRICIVQAILEEQDEEFLSEIKNLMQAVMYPENNIEKLKKYGDSAAT